jgi:organic radical activating enzyme
MVEITTDCNLRCTYCAVSQPEWKAQTMPANVVTHVIDELHKLKTKTVILHGHGETTMVEGWAKIAEAMLVSGFELTICTNLSKQYSDAELNILSRFRSITVSLDTIDPILFRQLQAMANNITWVWSSVVCDKTINELFKLVRYGHHMKVRTFCLCNLSLEPNVTLRHVSQLSKQEAISALSMLGRIQKYCNDNRLLLDVKAGLLDTLEKVVRGAILDPAQRRLYSLMP